MHLPPELLNPATWRTWSGWVFGDRALPSEVITTLFFVYNSNVIFISFTEFNDFIGAVEKGGVGAMEIVAMEMKHRGMYIARQLSFKDVAFKVDEVSLSPEFVKTYDDSVKMWVQLLHSFTEAEERVEIDHQRIVLHQVVGAHIEG